MDMEKPEDVLVGAMLAPDWIDKHALIFETLHNRLTSIPSDKARLALKASFSFYAKNKVSPGLIDIEREAERKFGYEFDFVGRTEFLSYIQECAMSTESPARVDFYLEFLLEEVAKHDIASIQKKYTWDNDVQHIISVIRQEVDKVEQGLFMGDKQILGEEYKSILHEIMDGKLESRPNMMTGIRSIDEMMGGIAPEDFIIIGARPSVGKTAFAVSIADRIMQDGSPISFYSYDMGKKQMILRLLSYYSRLTVTEIKSQEFKSRDGASRLASALETVNRLPVFMTFEHLNCASLCRSIRTDVRKRGVKAVFVDYLQIVPHPTYAKEYDAVTAVSKALKGLTHELDIPIVALSQLSRPQKGEERRPPNFSDLRSSGQLGQDASYILMLHRPPRDNESTLLSYDGSCILAKNQNGACGSVPMSINIGFRWEEK